MNIRNVITIFGVLLIIWVLLNNTLDPFTLIIGAGLSLLIAFTLCRKCDVFAGIRFTPKAIVFTFIYLGVFLIELVKSNIDVATRVLTPSLPINPGIVKVKTKLKSPMGRMILADSITLTPGTFTVDIKDEFIYIHWIDVHSEDIEKATEEIVRKFEKYLEVIYG